MASSQKSLELISVLMQDSDPWDLARMAEKRAAIESLDTLLWPSVEILEILQQYIRKTAEVFTFRGDVAKLLRRWPIEHSFPVLLGFIQDPEPQTRMIGLDVLFDYYRDVPATMPNLIPLFSDRDPHVRDAILRRYLTQCKSDPLFPDSIVCENKDYQRLLQFIGKFESITNQSSLIPHLFGFARDPDPFVSDLALRTLLTTIDPDPVSLESIVGLVKLSGDYTYQSMLMRLIHRAVQAPPVAFEYISEFLYEDNPDLELDQRTVVAVLTDHAPTNPAALACLQKAISSPSRKFVRRALKILKNRAG